MTEMISLYFNCFFFPHRKEDEYTAENNMSSIEDKFVSRTFFLEI